MEIAVVTNDSNKNNDNTKKDKKNQKNRAAGEPETEESFEIISQYWKESLQYCYGEDVKVLTNWRVKDEEGRYFTAIDLIALFGGEIKREKKETEKGRERGRDKTKKVHLEEMFPVEAVIHPRGLKEKKFRGIAAQIICGNGKRTLAAMIEELDTFFASYGEQTAKMTNNSPADEEAGEKIKAKNFLPDPSLALVLLFDGLSHPREREALTREFDRRCPPKHEWRLHHHHVFLVYCQGDHLSRWNLSMRLEDALLEREDAETRLSRERERREQAEREVQYLRRKILDEGFSLEEKKREMPMN